MGSDSKESGHGILAFWDAVIEGECIWVSNVNFNGLFKIYREHKESQFITRFYGEKEIGGLHKQVLKFENLLIFIPELGEQVALFDMKTEKIKYISVVLENSRPGESKTAGAQIYKNELWIFPQYLSQDIIIINLRTEEIRRSNIFCSFLGERKIQTESPAFGTPVFAERLVYIPLKNTKYIICFDVHKQEIRLHVLSDEKYRINSISISKCWGKLWITFSNELNVMSFHLKSGKEEIFNVNTAWDRQSVPFSCAIELKHNQLLILPAHTEHVILLEDKKVNELPYPDGFYWVKDFKFNWTRMGPWRENGDEIWIYPSVGNMMLIYHKEEKRLTGVIFKLPVGWDYNFVRLQLVLPNRNRDKIWSRLKETKITNERKEFDVKDFLAYICSHKIENEESKVRSCGEDIYKNLIG